MAVVVQSPNEVEEAAEFITSCVNISGIVGLEREVRVSVMTTEGTAEGKEYTCMQWWHFGEEIKANLITYISSSMVVIAYSPSDK